MSIIDKLYNEWYMTEYGNHPDTGEARKRFSALWGKAEETLDKDFSEELRNSIFAYMAMNVPGISERVSAWGRC